jgi:hypothetical protein
MAVIFLARIRRRARGDTVPPPEPLNAPGRGKARWKCQELPQIEELQPHVESRESRPSES